MNNSAHLKVGIIIIGRNEGERLRACFESIKHHSANSVYVDSDSTDDSVNLANSFGIKAISLDMSVPFSAARARNVGAEFILKNRENIKFLQFIDGDCTLNSEWISTALSAYQPQTAIVCGRRKEKHPNESVYNQLCDIEWNTPVGYTKSCGGDFMIKTECFKSVGGFNPSVVAGEEPELCYRLREKGFHILRIDHDMTYHDVDIHNFNQHWKRSVRSGYAYACGFYLHNKPLERHWLKENLSAIFWGVLIPSIVFIGSIFNFAFLLILLAYPLNTLKIYMKIRDKLPIPAVYSISLMLGKFSESVGILKFIKNIIFSQKHRIIEYK